MWRYTGIIDLLNIVKASVVSSFVVVAFVLFIHNFIGFARSVIIIDLVCTLLFVSALRICLRLYFEMISGNGHKIDAKLIAGIIKRDKKIKKVPMWFVVFKHYTGEFIIIPLQICYKIPP